MGIVCEPLRGYSKIKVNINLSTGTLCGSHFGFNSLVLLRVALSLLALVCHRGTCAPQGKTNDGHGCVVAVSAWLPHGWAEMKVPHILYI